MPSYNITTPDGQKYKVTAPDGATQEQVLSYAQEHHESKAKAPGLADTTKAGLAKIGSLWPDSVSPTDIALIPAAIGGEGLALKGVEAVGNAVMRAAPRIAQTMAETPELRGAARLAGAAGAGAAGWGGAGATSGAINAQPGERTEGAIEGAESGAKMGAEFGAGAKVAGAVIPPAFNAITHPGESAGRVIGTAQKVMKAAAKPVVKAALNSDNPIIGGGLKADLASKEAEAARALGERVGVNFSAAEQTGNAAARGVEDALANSPKFSSKFAEANETKADAVVKKFKETLDNISPTETNVANLGENLTKAYKGTIDSLVATRRAQAAADFGRATEATGGAPIVVPTNFIKVLDDYIKEGASPTATQEQIATASQAKKALSSLVENPSPPGAILDASGSPMQAAPGAPYKKITVKDLQNGLDGYGEAARSPGTITGGLKTASERRFANAAKHAFESDLDAAADSGKGEGAAALKVARDNYRNISGKIGDIQQTALGKIVGGAQRNAQGELVLFPERLSARFMSMEPTEIKATLKFLDQEHPDVAKMARRHTLEAAYQKASEGVGQSAAGGVNEFNMKQFVDNLPNDKKLAAILGDNKAVGDVKDVSEALNRLRWYGGRRGGSQTFGRTEILSGLRGWGLKKLYQSALDDTLAEDMLNPQKRAGLVAEANKINSGGGKSAAEALGAQDDPLSAAAP